MGAGKNLVVPWIGGPISNPLDIMSGSAKLVPDAGPHTAVENELTSLHGSILVADERWLVSLLTDDPSRVLQAREHILALKPGIARQQALHRLARGEHSQNVFHGQTTPSNDGFPAENLRVYRDAFQKLLLVHRCSLIGFLPMLPEPTPFLPDESR
jgi:hypothetical protein